MMLVERRTPSSADAVARLWTGGTRGAVSPDEGVRGSTISLVDDLSGLLTNLSFAHLI
jgi:hypothetical protein